MRSPIRQQNTYDTQHMEGHGGSTMGLRWWEHIYVGIDSRPISIIFTEINII